MTFRQYKLIKRLVRALSVFCVFAVFIHTLAVFSVFSIKAASSACGPVSIEAINSVVVEVKVNEEYKFRMNDPYAYTSSSRATYDYYAYAKDVATNKEYIKDSGSFSGSKDVSIEFDTKGDKLVWVVYRRTDYEGCTNQTTSETLSVKVVDHNDSPYLNITASANKALVGSAITITTEVRNQKGFSVQMSINDSIKWGAGMNEDSFSNTYNWDTTGLTQGIYKIKLKVFNSSGTMTEMKEFTINLCPAGGDLNNCASGNAEVTVTGGASGDTGGGVSVGGTFRTPIGNFTLSRGSGIGGLLQMIINFLLLIAGALAFISIMVGGIQYITAGGDSAKAEKAKKSILFSAIAIFLVTFSLVIINVINTTLVK